MKTIVFDITPIGKPRMVRSDIWSGRKCISDYYRFKDKLVILARAKRYKIGSTLNIVFQLPMAESWSEKKKRRMIGKPHTQKPDNDNMLKAFQDSLTNNDSGIWKVSMEKRWGETGKIIIKQ